MIKVIFLFLLLALVGCNPKPSDTDIGRVTEEDGFKVKDFMCLRSVSPDEQIKDVFRACIKENHLSNKEVITIQNTKTHQYSSYNYNKMLKITREDKKVREVYVEGDKDFIQEVYEKIDTKDSVKVAKLINVKKTYTQDFERIKKHVDDLSRLHELERIYLGNFFFDKDKIKELKSGNKRILLKGNSDYLIVIAEGEKPFVDELREKLGHL